MSNLLILLAFLASEPSIPGRCERELTQWGSKNRPFGQWLSQVKRLCRKEVPLLEEAISKAKAKPTSERSGILATAAMAYLPKECWVSNLTGTAMEGSSSCPRAQSLRVQEEMGQFIEVGSYLMLLALERQWSETDSLERRRLHASFLLAAANDGFFRRTKENSAPLRRTAPP